MGVNASVTTGKIITMRHEEKFICSEKQLFILAHRLQTLLPYDAHQEGECYRIRSLYLDTYDDRLYEESLNGLKKRHKYRIRFYNMQDDLFRLERKDTIGRLKQKTSAPFSKEKVERLLHREGFEMEEQELLQEVYRLQQTEGLHPVTIVDYFRTAFTYPDGNIRITFDKDISCTHRVEDFLDEHALLYPVMPYAKHVLEVKYDGILPGFIAAALNIGSLQQISFSKYAYARNVMNGNGRKEEGYEF